MQRRRWINLFALTSASLLLATGCVEKVTTNTGSGSSSGANTGGTGGSSGGAPNANVIGGSNANGEPVLAKYAGQSLGFGKVPDKPTKAGSGASIKLGMINQENTPLGSFPELRLGAEAAVKLINEELGGIDGRPLELVPCVTTFSVEKSQACAQDLVQKQVVGVTGGIDITSTGSIPVLEQNNMPYLGGIPINFEEMKSPISFQFSGGSPGAMVAFAKHASDSGAKKVVVLYGDYPPIKAAAVDYGVATLKQLGVPDVTEVPFNILATDFLPIITKANENNPDAIFVGAADTACEPAMRTAKELGVTAKMYFVGACAAPSIAEKLGVDAVNGKIFNIESETNTGDAEGAIYFAAVAKYGDPKLPAASAATISFRNVMNIYSLMKEIGADKVSPATLLDTVRKAKNRPSFNGHPYTCDGTQIKALPSMCAAQQVLVERQGDTLKALGGWIDVPKILAGG